MFKKILVSLLAAIICATASGKVIGEPRHSFHAGVEGTFSFTHRKDMSHIGLYRQVGALGSYTLRFSEYFINPELSLYSKRHKRAARWPSKPQLSVEP